MHTYEFEGRPSFDHVEVGLKLPGRNGTPVAFVYLDNRQPIIQYHPVNLEIARIIEDDAFYRKGIETAVQAAYDQSKGITATRLYDMGKTIGEHSDSKLYSRYVQPGA